MVDTDLGFLPVVAIDGFQDDVMVTDECRNIVLFPSADGVPTVVSEVVDHHVEIVEKQ